MEKSALPVSVRQMRQFLFCKTVLKKENANVEFFSTKFSTPLFCLTLWKTAGILLLFVFLNVSDEIFHILGEIRLFRLLALDFADGCHYRGVVAGEDRADLLIGLF